MIVLLIGSGGREHALAWKLCRSPRCERLYAAPGNPGMEDCAICVPLDPADHAAVIAFCRHNQVDLVVVGPEGPLVAGLVDDLAEAGILAFGPTRAAAQLEGSKGFTKDLCRQAGIPTAAYRRFDAAEPALAYAREHGAPMVVKADGLAAGKGVVVAETLPQAEEAITAMFAGSLGGAGAEVVIEDLLVGEEASLFALCDGTNAVLLASAQDHKRVLDGDQGPNTGGMGSYSPAPVVTPAVADAAMERIVRPTLRAMAERGMPFRGVLYAGLMIGAEGPQLIEYNVRFGDPETQVLMPRLKSDLLDALVAAARGQLGGITLEWADDAAVCVVMATRGYPGPVTRGSHIRGLEAAGSLEDVAIFHAGTRRDGDRILADGGRALGVTATGADVAAAQARAYEAVDMVNWPEGFCRRDIAWRAMERT